MTQPAVLGGTPVWPQGPPDWPMDWPEVMAAAQSCLIDGSWGRYHGPHCEGLVEDLKKFHGVEDALLCASGTAAVELALRGVRVEPGDEVILAAYDFKANFQNILTLGAIPVLVDVDPDSWQLDITKVESAISEKTRAIIVSHLHGGQVAMREIMEIADRHNLAVIEDACQATGAVLDSHRAGTVGHVGVLSFGGSKLLTAGRGGAILTSQPDIAQRIRLYNQRGNEAYPLSELQAAVIRPQLKQLDEQNRIRLENVRRLIRQSGSVTTGEGDPVLNPLAAACPDFEDQKPAFYKVGFRYSQVAHQTLSRENFAKALRAEGIALDAGFRSLHRIHSKRRFRASSQLTSADHCDERILVLHHPVLLKEAGAMDDIKSAVERVIEHSNEIQAALGSC